MKKLAFLLLLLGAPCLVPQTLTKEDLHVYLTHASALFAAHTEDFSKLDFANMKALQVETGEWQELKQGRGKTAGGSRVGTVEVWFSWQHRLDSEHWVAAYDWMWTAGSSSQSSIVQVFERRGDKVFITQQIEVDTHHGGRAVGAWFDPARRVLTVKAVNYAPFEGRCCPSLMGVVDFRWQGQRFHRTDAKRVLLPGSRANSSLDSPILDSTGLNN